MFRGIGDSKTPLLTVAVACVINILADLLLVAGFGMGAAGAAIATVSAQAISVVCSLYLIRKKKLPFLFSKTYIRFDGACLKKILWVGVPIALQEMLVQFSFLFIQVVVNGMGVMESAAVGVAGAFCVRIPVVYLMSRLDEASLFHIGLGTPISSAVQITLCAIAYSVCKRERKGNAVSSGHE